MDIEALVNEKKRAIEEEDFLRAAEIKKQLAEIDIGALENEKRKAVEEEDFLLAAELKKEIELLTLEQSKGKPGGSSTTTTTTATTKTASPTPVASNSSRNGSPSTTSQPASPTKKIVQKTYSGQLKSPTGIPTTPRKVTAPDSFSSSPIKSPLAGKSTASGSISPTRTPDALNQDLNNNPLQFDPILREMIDQLDDIDSYRPFKLWKSSFLNRFEEFLSEEGAPLAAKAYNEFRGHMTSFVKVVKQVQTYVEKGDLTEEKTTVKGRNSLNEMNKWLVTITAEERELVPAKANDEQRRGYTKFHLGAVLVRDGFKEHEQLNICSDILKRLRSTSLANVADKQIIEEMENFERQMIRFRDIMADLGLLEVMLKCWQLSDPEDEFIFVDLKTGAIGCISVGSCLEKGAIHTVKDNNGNEIAYLEAISDLEDRETVLDLVKEVLKI